MKVRTLLIGVLVAILLTMGLATTAQAIILDEIPTLTLNPPSDTNPVGTDHTVTALFMIGGVPQAGVPINFVVISGPNMDNSGMRMTDANGEATFTYRGDGGEGEDIIRATVELDAGDPAISAQAIKLWEPVGPPPQVPGITGWGILAAVIVLAALSLVMLGRRRRVQRTTD